MPRFAARLQLAALAAALILRAPPALAAGPDALTESRERPAADEIRHTVASVLSSEEYVFDDLRKPKENWLTRLAKWLSRALASERFANVSPAAFWAILAACMLGLGLIFYHVFTILRRALRVRATAAKSLERDEAGELLPRDPDALREMAVKHAAKGEYRLAFRRLFAALLITLDERKLIRCAAEKTNWEYVREAAGTTAHEDLRRLTVLFDRKWYGREGWQPGEYERCADLVSSVVAEVAG